MNRREMLKTAAAAALTSGLPAIGPEPTSRKAIGMAVGGSATHVMDVTTQTCVFCGLTMKHIVMHGDYDSVCWHKERIWERVEAELAEYDRQTGRTGPLVGKFPGAQTQ